MIAKLIVGGREFGFTKALPISTNLSAVDVREPDKRQTTHSKTISIPGTQDVIEYFEYIFDVNTDLQTFNPNKISPAYYEVNNLPEFSGNLQLKEVVKRYSGTVLELFFNCTIVATIGNMFQDISTKFLTDLDMSDLNHTLDYANFSATPTPGIGYCYGYIDYGVGGLNGYNWDVEAMKAAIWEKEYVDRIFAVAGKTYTSAFLNSAYYSKIAIPDIHAGPYKMSQAQIDNEQFYAGRTTTQTTNVAGTYSSAWRYGTIGATIAQPVQINNDSTSPFYDAGGNYNTGTYIFTAGINGWFKLVFDCAFTLNFNLPATGVTIGGSQVVLFDIERSTDGGATWSSVAPFTDSITKANGPPTLTTSRVAQVNLYAVSGTQFRCIVRNNGVSNWTVLDAGASPVTTGTSSMDFVVNTSVKFYALVSQTTLSFGNTIDMNTTIPDNVKQLDFLMSIFKSHNLYLEQDKNDENNYIIEPRESFINYNIANAQNWTRKQDLSKDITILPMNALDAKKYSFSYKSDKDYFNADYEDKFKEVYGYRKVDVDNDFVKSEKKIDLIFSPTPGASFQTNIVAPRFLTIEGGYPGTGTSSVVKPLKCNIRRLYWGGLKNCDVHQLRVSAGAFVPGGTNYIQPAQYPSLNHFDDAFNPTVDLNFDAAKEQYFQSPAQMWTNNNLYGYYSAFISEITDPNSKVIETYIYMDELDIYNFSFRNLVFIENAYYFVNKIMDYDPQERKVCKVELLKLKKGPVFSPAVYNPGTPPAGQNATNFILPQFNNLSNYGQSGTLLVGQNISHQGVIGMVSGRDIIIDRAVTGFDGIGLTNQVIGPDLSNQTMIRDRALVVGDNGVTEMKKGREVYSSNFNVVLPISYIDATGGNIDAILPNEVTNNGEYKLVRIDNSANTVTIYGNNGTELLRSVGISGTSVLLNTGETLEFTTDHHDWYY